MGFLYTFTILTLLVVAGINNSVALFAYTMLLVSLGIMTMLLTNSNMSQVAVESPSECLGCEGSELIVPILLRSKTGSECINLRLECWGDKQLLGFKDQISIAKDRELTCHVPVRLNNCGITVVDTIKVSSSYPLGLFKTWTLIASNIELYAHPKPLGKNLKGQQRAENHSYQKQKNLPSNAEPDDYYGLRPFRPGDSMQHVDWKAAARSREWLIKEWSSPMSLNYIFNLDMVPAKNLLSKLRQLALWVIEAEKQGSAYSLYLGADKNPISSLTPSLKALTQYGHKHL